MERTLTLVQGNIVTQAVDAIVNAANSSLLGGGGVDGAIHRAAGPELLAYNRTLGGCPPGEARLAPGFRLPARHVIHTVGPVWRGGGQGEAEVLARCYRSALGLARAHGLRTVAFPSISTGAYGYPIEEAAPVALREMRAHLRGDTSVERVTVVLFSAEDLADYRRALAALEGAGEG
jgi:O-acetyl-ADP-ribose deacetylase